MVTLDRTEKKIIHLLQRDGRMSFVDMAANIGVTEGTVRRKYYRLVNEGIIRIVGIADPFQVGFSSLTIIGLNVEPGKIEDVARKVGSLDSVKHVVVTTGNSDIIIQAYFPKNEDLASFVVNQLTKIDGVREVNTSLILGVYKQSFDWGVAL